MAPPRGHLDGRTKSGSAFLTQEVVRVRPRLVVYGHIHEGHTTKERFYNRVGKGYKRVSGHGAGKRNSMGIVWGVMLGYLIPRPW